MNRKIQVTVIGDHAEIAVNNIIAEKVGAFVAEHCWVLITGGKGGVMEAASRGAFRNGGLVVSLLPGESLDEGHDHAGVKIPTGIGFARNSMNVLSGDVVVAIGGQAGTLSEICYAWAYGKVIIAFVHSEGWSAKLAGTALDDRRNDVIIGVSGIEEFKKAMVAIAEKIG